MFSKKYIKTADVVSILKAVRSAQHVLENEKYDKKDAAVKTIAVLMMEELTDFNYGEMLFLAEVYAPDPDQFFDNMDINDFGDVIASLGALYGSMIEHYEEHGIDKETAKKMNDSYNEFMLKQDKEETRR